MFKISFNHISRWVVEEVNVGIKQFGTIDEALDYIRKAVT